MRTLKPIIYIYKITTRILKSINPYTNQVIANYTIDDAKTVDAKINNAHKAFENWRKLTIQERIKAILTVAQKLEHRKQEYAALMTSEMGKLYAEGIAEIEKCQLLIKYYAEHAEGFLDKKSVKANYTSSEVYFEPLGVCLGIMPWNFPFWQVMRFAIPTLIAGNTIVLKHASNVQGCAEALQSLFDDNHIPNNIFTNLVIPSKDMKGVINHSKIKGISLTGSTNAGKAVAKIAAKHLKKCVFELGGSDPYVVLKDADLALTIEACANARLRNAGQSCIAGKRFIVEEAIAENFIKALKEKFQEYKIGNPLDATTTLAPMATIDLRNELHEQVVSSVQKGASIVLGGKIESQDQAFYPATILKDVAPGMPAFEDELFGPVAAVIVVKNEEEAIRVANTTSFGLGAAIFSKNVARAKEIAISELSAGSCFVNGLVRSDPKLPFGGINESGYGRELSAFGMHEFCNIKTVVVI